MYGYACIAPKNLQSSVYPPESSSDGSVESGVPGPYELVGLSCCGRSGTVVEVALHPTKANIVYMATNDYIYKTCDGGKSWENMSAGMTHSRVITLAIDPQQPQTLYAGTSGGVYKSVDGSQACQTVNAGLMAANILKSSRSLGVTRIKNDPFNPDRVYISTLNGLCRSGNAGESWRRIGEFLPDYMLSELLLDPHQPGVMYVGHREGISKSEDNGVTWETRNMGLTNINIRALAISSIDSHILYVGTNGKGLFQSFDSGMSWNPLPLTVD